MSFMDVTELLGNLGDFVGGIIIIISLIYLARQVRQNTRALQGSYEIQSINRTYDMVIPVAKDRRVAEWWVSGADKLADLDAIDQQRIKLWEYAAIELWWANYLARKHGMLSDEFWQHQMALVEAFGGRDSVRAAWQEFKPVYNDEFRQLIDPHLSPK